LSVDALLNIVDVSIKVLDENVNLTRIKKYFTFSNRPLGIRPTSTALSASPDITYNLMTLSLDTGSGQLLFERYQTGSLSNWCWQGIPNTGGLWEETVCSNLWMLRTVGTSRNG
jgi:hypothetical protein